MNASKMLSVTGILVVTLIIGGCSHLSHLGHRFGHRGFHHGFHGKGFPERALKRLDKKVKKLALSEEQQKKYEEIRQTLKDDMVGMAQRRDNLLGEIKTEVEKDNPDMNVVAAMMKKQLGHFPVTMEKHIDHIMDFYYSLDENQKSQVIEWLRKKSKRF